MKNRPCIPQSVKTTLQQYPPAVLDEFCQAFEPMTAVVNTQQLDRWAQAGLDIAAQTVRSWEAAAKFFRVSPNVVVLMPFNYFEKWAACGIDLCSQSPALATSYFVSSPSTMAVLRSRHIERWANLGSSLYKGTWKSSSLSCKFFESSPSLLKNLTLSEFEKFVKFLEEISNRSYDLATECIALGSKLFPLLGNNKDFFITLSSSLAKTNWRQVKNFFDANTRAIPNIESGQHLEFLQLIDKLIKAKTANIPVIISDISKSFGQLGKESHEPLFNLAGSLAKVSPVSVSEFLKTCPKILGKISLTQLEKWFDKGLKLLEQNPEGGLAYFKLESKRSEDILESLSSSVEFDRIKDVMEMYCRALAGSELKLSQSEELVEKNIGWVSGEKPSTEGSTVFLPSTIDRYKNKEENFGWYKVVSTHQVSHLEFGSFQFDFGKPSEIFEDARPHLDRINTIELENPESYTDTNSTGLEKAWVTDMQRFFDKFPDRTLALDIFTVLEDGRLDVHVKTEYPGIKQAYRVVQNDTLNERPEIKSLPMREAVLEFIVRLSLEQHNHLEIPSKTVNAAKEIIRVARRLFVVKATVEDTAEATIRIYAILSQIPNTKLKDEDWENINLGDDIQNESTATASLEELLRQLMTSLKSEPENDFKEEKYEPTQEVEYRGEFKPELVQLLVQLKDQQEEQGSETSAESITQEMVEQMLEQSAELNSEAMSGEVRNQTRSLASSMLKQANLNLPKSSEMGQGPLVHVDEEGGELDPAEPQTFAYNEWDFRADDYKPRWCIVKQKTMAEGDPDYYGTTLHSYGSLVTQVKRQFELMVPEMFRKVRKLEDGEEIDIDDVIEAFVDKRTGASPSNKLFWRRNKVQRDVAVVFLLDTSASTAEAIDETRNSAEDLPLPSDQSEYMSSLRSRRNETPKRSYKRIIDVEKEAIVLLINALEAIGDTYGIYGFSGYGRENVEFYIVKDVDERLSERVKKRIDRIAPLHATRMGPAIRHATSKLEMQDAKTKLLFLISDGRPQDRGYSREGVEKEYAVHDTKKALDEAKDKNVTAFCLTVDKNGHDYLKTMCQDIGYEVLDNIYALPQRLLYLYKRLTM